MQQRREGDAVAALYVHLCQTGDKPVPGLGSDATASTELAAFFSERTGMKKSFNACAVGIIHVRCEDGGLGNELFYTPSGKILEPSDPRLADYQPAQQLLHAVPV